jgi:membrane associated rhomboid family serine protease
VNRSGTFALALVTVGAWFFIAGGSDSLVTIYELAGRGAATREALRAGQVWTLLTSQFVHVYRLHMLLNVAHLLLLGWWLEPRLRTPRFLLVYLLGGAVGQVAVILTGAIATGASQSVAALAGAAAMTARTRWQMAAVAIVMAMILGLDFFFAQTIKVGHATAFIAGTLLSTAPRKRVSKGCPW